jgi:hypothetical protein
MSGAPDLVTWVGTKLLLEPLLELIAGAGEGEGLYVEVGRE